MSTIEMSMNPNSAYLEIILGGMYAGKTTRLIEIYRQCKFCNISVAVINHSFDNRYDDELLSSHDKIKIPCIKTQNLMELWRDKINLEEDVSNIPRIKEIFKVLTSNVLLINEGQFFPDLEGFVKKMLSIDKKIYVCGLDGDFQRNKFGQILDLIPLCDKVTKLTSLCSICRDGTPGIFSKRITSETAQTVIGSDNYIPVCRNCYEKDNEKNDV
jgi:thymidine kinase